MLSRLSEDERHLLKELALLASAELVTRVVSYVLPRIAEANETEQPEFTYLLECGILAFNPGTSVLGPDGTEYQLGGGLTVSGKGVRWITYLKNTNRLPA